MFLVYSELYWFKFYLQASFLPKVQKFSSSDGEHDGTSRDSGTENGAPTGFASWLCSLDCSLKVVRKFLSAICMNREKCSFCLESALVNDKDCVHRSIHQKRTLFGAVGWAIIVNTQFSKWSDAIFKSSLAESDPACIVSSSAFWTTFTTAKSCTMLEQTRSASFWAIWCIAAQS